MKETKRKRREARNSLLNVYYLLLVSVAKCNSPISISFNKKFNLIPEIIETIMTNCFSLHLKRKHIGL